MPRRWNPKNKSMMLVILSQITTNELTEVVESWEYLSLTLYDIFYSRVLFCFCMYCRVLIAGRSSGKRRAWWRGGSSVAGRVNVATGRCVPLVSAPSWMAAAAAKPVHGRLGNHATKGISVTLTKACTVTFPKTSHVMKLASVLVSERIMKNPRWLLQSTLLLLKNKNN